MTVLALRAASASNGVSKLHGEVSRGMWKGIWPGVPQDEIPIGHVTNGVHFRSWISAEMNQLYDRYLGPKWREEHADPDLWRRVESIPAEELWRTHERRRERLVAFARRRLHLQLLRRGAPQSEIDAADEVLDPDTLTIGFARRFATYKPGGRLKDSQAVTAAGMREQAARQIRAGRCEPGDKAGQRVIGDRQQHKISLGDHLSRLPDRHGRQVLPDPPDRCLRDGGCGRDPVAGPAERDRQHGSNPAGPHHADLELGRMRPSRDR